MASEMVERVESAIQHALVKHGIDAERLAFAALAALRDPTDAMLNVPFVWHAKADLWDSLANRRAFWQAMIDAALR